MLSTFTKNSLHGCAQPSRNFRVLMVESPIATCKGKMEKRKETKLWSKIAHMGSNPSSTNFWAAFATKILISVHLSYFLSRLHQGSCDHWNIPHLRKH